MIDGRMHPLVHLCSQYSYLREREKRMADLLTRNGWQVRFIFIHPKDILAERKGAGHHIIYREKVVSNAIVNQFVLVPLLIGLEYLKVLRRDWRRIKLLYVYSHPDANSLPLIILGRLFGIPTIYDVRDPWKEFVLTETEAWVRKRRRFKVAYGIMSFIEGTAIKLASGVAYANPSLQDLHRIQSERKPSCVVNNYSSYSSNGKVMRHVEELRARLDLTNCIVFSYIGSGFPNYRGVETLVEGVALAMKRNSQIRFLLGGGQGGSLDSIRNKIRECGIEDRCVITGWIPGEAMIYYFQMSDVGVICHKRTPATELTVPNKLFNYLALGKPIIITNLREQSRYFADGVCGFKITPDDPVEFANSIVKLADNSDLRKQMSANALKVGEQYKFEKVEPTCLELLHAVLGDEP